MTVEILGQPKSIVTTLILTCAGTKSGELTGTEIVSITNDVIPGRNGNPGVMITTGTINTGEYAGETATYIENQWYKEIC